MCYKFSNYKLPQHTKMELHIFNFYCARLSVPSELTRCCDNIVNEVVGYLHQQLKQTSAVNLTALYSIVNSTLQSTIWHECRQLRHDVFLPSHN